MPLPPDNAVEAAEAGTVPDFEFTKVECLMFAFHTVARQAPEYLSQNEDRSKDFKVSFRERLAQNFLFKRSCVILGQVKLLLEGSSGLHSEVERVDPELNSHRFKEGGEQAQINRFEMHRKHSKTHQGFVPQPANLQGHN